MGPVAELLADLSARVYAMLLAAYPRDFRDRHRNAMHALFRDRCRVAAVREGALGVVRLWLPTGWDLAHTAFSERREAWTTRRRSAGRPMEFAGRREQERGGGMDSFMKDLRYGVRTLVVNPAFTLVAVLTIALGIGANTAIFSVVEAVLLRPLPYDRPEQLVLLWGELRQRNMSDWPHSPPDFRDYREQSQLFQDLAAIFTFAQPLTGEGDPVQVDVAGITQNFFSLLGVSPTLGRDFVADDVIPPPPDAQPGTANPPPPTMVILSHGFWQRHFGGSPDVLGRTVELGGAPAIVVGVLPRTFRLLMPPSARLANDPDIWAAARIDFDGANRNNVFLRVVGRLNEGVTVDMAQAEMTALGTRLREQDQVKETAGFTLHVIPLHEDLTEHVRPVMLALLGAVAFVLLIACANVSNLLLVRASLREKELAVRAAMGGSRARLFRQMLVESGVLGLAGGLLGLVLAYAGIRLLLALQPEDLPRIETVAIDGMVLGFTAAAALLAALVFGMLPAVQASKPHLTDSLKERSQAATSRFHQAVRNGVVIVEVALSLVLLIGAGLMIRSFVELTRVDPGYDAEGVLTFGVSLPFARYPEIEDRVAFQDLLTQRIEALPGVASASAAFPVPLDDQAFAGRYGPLEAQEDETLYGQADYRVVLPGFFETMGTRLVAGRTFTGADNSDSAAVVVVDEKLAAALWPKESPVGKQMLIRVTTPDAQPVEVIGVVEHQRHPSVATEGRETVFFADRYVGSFGALTWTVRTSRVEPMSVVGPIRDEIAALDPLIPMADIRSMEDYVEESMAPTRFALVLISVFGGLALALATVGLYGVLSYVVRQRTAEIGIRMAFGAEAAGILRMVAKQGLSLVFAGIVLGVLVALGITRVMESFLVGVTPTDPATFAGISLLFTVVATVASMVPARRATRVDPVVALREE